MTFTEAETAACQRLVDMALKEDLGEIGDITTQLLIPPKVSGSAAFVARTDGVVAGLPAVALAFGTAHTPFVQFHALVEDGTRVQPGQRLATVAGLMEFILTGERTALNFLQHMSGIATLTRRYVDAIAGLPCKILDTRKTTPGWRLLEKYAVRAGGGRNHRLGLYDGILIKDNHLAALADSTLPVYSGREKLLSKDPKAQKIPLEVEIDNVEQLKMASMIGPDVILLDNMSPKEIHEAVEWRNANIPHVKLEASGGVTLTNVRSIAEAGVDFISVGALTHSAPALDIGLDFEGT